MDVIKQSVCIYEAILADVDKNYPMRGGGGIGRIVPELNDLVFGLHPAGGARGCAHLRSEGSSPMVK